MIKKVKTRAIVVKFSKPSNAIKVLRVSNSLSGTPESRQLILAQ
jgi:hypothetical protein